MQDMDQLMKLLEDHGQEIKKKIQEEFAKGGATQIYLSEVGGQLYEIFAHAYRTGNYVLLDVFRNWAQKNLPTMRIEGDYQYSGVFFRKM